MKKLRNIISTLLLCTAFLGGLTSCKTGDDDDAGAAFFMAMASNKASYTVTFDANGGVFATAPAPITVSAGSTITAPATTPTKAGFNFAGWNTKADGTGLPFSTTVNASVTYYAQWTSSSTTVSLTSLTANETSVNVPFGGTRTVSFTLTPADATCLWNISQTVGSIITNNGTVTVTLLSGGLNGTFTLTDTRTNISASVAVTYEPLNVSTVTATPLTAGTAAGTTAADFTGLATELTDTNPSAIYKINIPANKVYTFQFADGNNTQGLTGPAGICQFQLFDSSSTRVASWYSNNSYTNYKNNTASAADYYLVVTKILGSTAKAGVRVYTAPLVTSITPSATSVTVPFGGKATVTYTYAPATGAVRSWTRDSTSTIWPSSGPYDDNNGNVTVTFRNNGNSNGNYVLKEENSGVIAASVAVTYEAFNASTAATTATTLTAGTAASSNASDYTGISTEINDTNPYAVYKVTIPANTVYIFQLADEYNKQGLTEPTGYARFNLYDSSSNILNSFYSTSTNTSCKNSGATAADYYLVVTRNGDNPVKAGVRVYTPALATGLALSETSLTIPVGETRTITITPTPASANVSYSYWSSDYSVATYISSGNTVNISAVDGGTATVTVRDDISGMQATCTVNVSLNVNTDSITDVLSVGNASSSAPADYTFVTLDSSTKSKYYKVNLEAGKTYNFEGADNYASAADVKAACSMDAYFKLYNSSLIRKLSWDDGNNSFTVPAGEGGVYYFAIVAGTRTTGKAGVHVYTSN